VQSVKWEWMYVVNVAIFGLQKSFHLRFALLEYLRVNFVNSEWYVYVILSAGWSRHWQGWKPY